MITPSVSDVSGRIVSCKAHDSEFRVRNDSIHNTIPILLLRCLASFADARNIILVCGLHQSC
jgi:hypothetical protein